MCIKYPYGIFRIVTKIEQRKKKKLFTDFFRLYGFIYREFIIIANLDFFLNKRTKSKNYQPL